MATTFTVFESRFRQTYNGIAQADLLALLQEIHDEISSRCQLYDEGTEDVTWTAADVSNGVRRWALSANVRRVWDAYYFTSATESFQLKRTNKHKLDKENEGWRQADAGTPSQWYEDGGYVGLHAKPDTAPTAGYPKVVLYTFERQTLTTGSSLPGQVASVDAWLYGCLFKYADSRDKANSEFYEQKYLRARRELIADIKAINARDFAQAQAYVPAVTNL
jgi:hypothetical protein